MQIGGITLWLLIGMFGFGAAVGLMVGVFLAKRLFKPVSGDWGLIFEIFFALAGILVAMPLTGIAAVAVTFAAHHLGWERPLPYLAGIGLIFLTMLASWILWIIGRSPSTRG